MKISVVVLFRTNMMSFVKTELRHGQENELPQFAS
jgi:hypothetical protein